MTFVGQHPSSAIEWPISWMRAVRSQQNLPEQSFDTAKDAQFPTSVARDGYALVTQLGNCKSLSETASTLYKSDTRR